VWRKASYSGTEQGACVEVAALDGSVGVRDSKNPAAGHIALSVASFADLIARVKQDELNG
jgi:hypothetical protein